MKKYGFFALFLAVALLLSACGAKMPEDDLAWYPAEGESGLVSFFALDRTPGACSQADVGYLTAEYKPMLARWTREGGSVSIEPYRMGSGVPAERSLRVAGLRALTQQADRFVWKELGENTAYTLSGRMNVENLKGELTAYHGCENLHPDRVGTFSVSEETLTESADPAAVPADCVGYAEIINPRAEETEDIRRYYYIYLVP